MGHNRSNEVVEERQVGVQWGFILLHSGSVEEVKPKEYGNRIFFLFVFGTK